MMKHQVVINVTNPNGESVSVLRGAQLTLPKRIVKWLFGDYTQVVLLNPGQTVEFVNVKEIKEGV